MGKVATEKVATETKKVATQDATYVIKNRICFVSLKGAVSEHSHIWPREKPVNTLGDGVLKANRKGGIQMQDNQIHIDLDSIPESVRMQLIAVVHEAAREYIQQPGIQEKFERWREQREAKKSATQENK